MLTGWDITILSISKINTTSNLPMFHRDTGQIIAKIVDYYYNRDRYLCAAHLFGSFRKLD